MTSKFKRVIYLLRLDNSEIKSTINNMSIDDRAKLQQECDSISQLHADMVENVQIWV